MLKLGLDSWWKIVCVQDGLKPNCCILIFERSSLKNLAWQDSCWQMLGKVTAAKLLFGLENKGRPIGSFLNIADATKCLIIQDWKFCKGNKIIYIQK